MKPKQLVPTQKTCEKLDEAGWERETCFYWTNEPLSYTEFTYTPWMVERKPFKPDHLLARGAAYAAPTVAELLDAMSEANDEVLRKRVHISIARYYDRPMLYWAGDWNKGATPAEAAASLWLELKKEGLIKDGKE